MRVHRPVLHDGAVMQWSGADESQRHPAEVRSSSPGLLAFIPFPVAQDAVVSILDAPCRYPRGASVESRFTCCAR